MREYDTSHPRGRMTEERDALLIQALFASDRGEEARALATRFKARYPNSLLLPAVADTPR